MGRSRYANTPIIDGKFYGTWSIPIDALGYRGTNLLEGVQTISYTWKAGDRFDKLSELRYNDPDYWWIIALVNNIFYPWGITPGREIRIPLDYRDILRKVQP